MTKKKRNPKDATDSVEARRRRALEARLTKRINRLEVSQRKELVRVLLAMGDLRAWVDNRIAAAEERRTPFDRRQRKRQAVR
jgi:hypothetical protein